MLIDEFKIRIDVKMYSQLHGYGDFHGFDLPSDMELSPISKRMFKGFAMP